jgi:hypothetical protein
MPFPRNLLDTVICSEHPELPLYVEDLNMLISLWQEREWIDEDGRCLTRTQLVEGGFAKLMVVYPEKVLLYANHQGGYKVLCPIGHQGIAETFSYAVEEWRRGGARTMHCTACEQNHSLEDVILKPKGAFSNGALIFRGVESIHFTEVAKTDIKEILGKNQVVYRRLA